MNKPGGYQCICVNGWTGHDCSENVDDCSTAACESGATCIDRVGHFYCQCPPGKTGLLCQLDDGCFHNPCNPNATCDTSPIDGRAICTCPSGFTGPDCSTDNDECAAGSPCEHGGSCVNTPGSFRCECPRGFTGSRCEININECDKNPCMNDGTCLDEKGGYKCICMPGFAGQRCQIDIDECAQNPCENGAICKDHVNSFRCHCQPGYWGERCEFPLNKSLTNPSDNMHSELTPCPVGWEGFACSEDVDECTLRNRCKNDGICVNYPGSYRCDCPENFTGPNCERMKTACENKPCMNNANCIDSLTDGTYMCECSEGYFGQHCERDSCLVRPCENNGSCMKVMNKYLCSCPPGYSGQRCEKQFAVTTPPPDLTSYSQPPLKSVLSCSKCKNGASCATLPTGKALCFCKRGFSGPDCSIVDLEIEPKEFKNECEIRDCEAKRHNGKCDQECNSLSCSFDGGDCLLGTGNPWAKCSNPFACWTAFKDGKCDQECNTAECLYDGNDCVTSNNDKQLSPATATTSRTCDEKSDSFCLKNYANGICDQECNNAECGWDGADCETPINRISGGNLIPVSTEAQGLLVIRVEPAIEIGGTNSESHWNIELARLLRKVSVVTGTILKIQNFRQVEEGRGTEIELIADNRKCQASCYNSTELIAKFMSALKARTKDFDRSMTSGALRMTDIRSQTQTDINDLNGRSAATAYVVICGSIASVCAIVMVISKGSKQKVKEKAIVWFPEGFKPVLGTRNRDPTNRKGGRGVSTLQAITGNFLRGPKRNERTISTDPNGIHSSDIDRCGTATPNGGGIYHEPYDQYDQYGTYNGTDSGSMVNNVDEPMTPTPMSVNPINIEGPHGLTPLMVASMGPPFSKEPLGLVAYGTTSEMNGAADNNVADLLHRGAQVNLANKVTGETALHLAARHGRVDAARGLLERCDSQDVNAQDATGRTPLHTAIAADSLGVFELLIRCRGTDLNAQTHDGTTPLILATRVGTYSMLEELILNECEVTKSDANGKTALHWAAATNNVDAIRRLLAVRETNKDAQDLAEETPLFLAAREGAKGAIEILLNHNANKDISDQMDRSPIEIARSRQHYDIVRLLEEHEPPTPRSINSMHHSSRQLSPFSPTADSNSNSNSSSAPPPPSYHTHSQSGNGGRNGGRQAQKAALARSSSTKPLIAEANIIRNNLQNHCKSVMMIKTEEKDAHDGSANNREVKTLGRRATQSTSSSHQAIQPNMHMSHFSALSANNVVMPATPNSLTNSLSPVSSSMMSPPTNSLHHLNSPTKPTPPINGSLTHRQHTMVPNQVPPPAYDECQTFWTNNNNPNMVSVNNNMVDKTHGLSEVYNVPCLKNYMTPSPDSPFSLESSMASPPGVYTDQQYQNPSHPSLTSQKQAGVFI